MPKKTSNKLTIREVAKAAGVAPITASRAFSDPQKVKSETRKKVQKAAKELGYIPNLAAGTLSSNVSKLIGVVVPNMAHSFFSDILQTLTKELRKEGFQILLGDSSYNLDDEYELVRTFLGRGADAIVLTGHIHAQETVEILRSNGLPVVEMLNLGQTAIDTTVGVSNFEAAKAATKHLIGQDYRNIAYIGGSLESNDRAQSRLEGYKSALTDAGIDLNDKLIRICSLEASSGATAAASLLEENAQIDAFFVASDIVALGALFECQRQGISVPDQVAIIGFDDAQIASIVNPALSTIMIPRREIGAKIAEVILARLGGADSLEKVFDLGFQLVLRDTA